MPTTRSPSRANATCCDCSNDRRSAAADRPLSKSSATRSAFACSQSTPAQELSKVTLISKTAASGQQRRVIPEQALAYQPAPKAPELLDLGPPDEHLRLAARQRTRNTSARPSRNRTGDRASER